MRAFSKHFMLGTIGTLAMAATANPNLCCMTAEGQDDDLGGGGSGGGTTGDAQEADGEAQQQGDEDAGQVQQGDVNDEAQQGEDDAEAQQAGAVDGDAEVQQGEGDVV